MSRNLFSIANECFVKKQLKYFDIPLDHAWKVPIMMIKVMKLIQLITITDLNLKDFKINHLLPLFRACIQMSLYLVLLNPLNVLSLDISQDLNEWNLSASQFICLNTSV